MVRCLSDGPNSVAYPTAHTSTCGNDFSWTFYLFGFKDNFRSTRSTKRMWVLMFMCMVTVSASCVNEYLLNWALSARQQIKQYRSLLRSFWSILCSNNSWLVYTNNVCVISIQDQADMYLISMAVAVKELYWQKAERKPDERSVIRLCPCLCVLCTGMHLHLWACGYIPS